MRKIKTNNNNLDPTKMLNVRKYELATFYANSEIYGCRQHLVLAHLKAHFSQQGYGTKCLDIFLHKD